MSGKAKEKMSLIECNTLGRCQQRSKVLSMTLLRGHDMSVEYILHILCIISFFLLSTLDSIPRLRRPE